MVRTLIAHGTDYPLVAVLATPSKVRALGGALTLRRKQDQQQHSPFAVYSATEAVITAAVGNDFSIDCVALARRPVATEPIKERAVVEEFLRELKAPCSGGGGGGDGGGGSDGIVSGGGGGCGDGGGDGIVSGGGGGSDGGDGGGGGGYGNILVVLDRLSQPENVGGVFRSAVAFGACGVLMSPTCADPLVRRREKGREERGRGERRLSCAVCGGVLLCVVICVCSHR